MKFFFGVAIGALGMWAYQSGKLDGLMRIAPERAQQVWQPTAERVGQVMDSVPVRQVMNSDQVRQVASSVQRKVQDTVQQTRGAEIVTPSAAEVSGRPSEPLPTPGA